MEKYQYVTDVEPDVWELLMEYGLTQVVRMGCECETYLSSRKNVIIPEIIEMAKRTGETPVDIFIRFQKRLHARHEHPTAT